ncbi:restriction endonuclease subunit S [Vibrio sp. 10N.286.46.E10]|uniref:restriction endonuclease subunit S n=1 Tax=Vibrio sp. 10N.286.46.E10 TaxID=1884477 RepID=UPI000C85458C|nr:restriction endonuclease subunit S [Vibrio sp. 10N.286.46.E10]PMI23889.1 restriction endonuclease subunit S [Vibrio sp. 10N.286.46.E10]
MSELPKGWVELPLEQVATWGSGGTPKRSEPSYYGGDIPWVKTGDLGPRCLKEASEYISQLGLEKSSAKLFPKGSVAIAMYGATIGKTSTLDFEASTNQACAVGNPIDGVISTDFLYYFLTSEKQNFIKKGKGGAQPNISQQLIKAHEIKLPSLVEQKRIVEKLDEVLAQVDTIKARLDGIPDLLKRFRQTVLASAVSGKLTEEWRLTNELTKAEEELKSNFLAKSGKLKLRGKQTNFSELSLITLPDSWTWAQNYKLAKDESNAICAGPFGTIFKAKDFRDEGVPIIFLRHVKEIGFNQNKPNYMDGDVWEELHQEYSVHGGELLVTKLGDPPGECCIYPENMGTAMVTPDVLKMNVDEDIVLRKYLRSYFNSPISTEIIEALAFGATRLRIDIAMFKGFPIPLPSMEEQKEIVRLVDQYFAFADTIEAQVKKAQAKVDNLTQSILAKAFRGELVSQDPSDEPADKLLERIAKAREEAEALAKAAKKAEAAKKRAAKV